MRRSIALPVAAIVFLLCSVPALAAKVESFSPRGETKGARQVVAKFSAPMVAFGDPRSESPFEVSCAAPGRGRWIDARVWAYDFNADVPGGIECAFVLKAALRSQSGEVIEGERRFVFSTGGPSISTSWPEEGSTIDESQVFLLALDAAADVKTMTANAYCQAAGITERLPLRVIEGDERNRIITEQKGRARNFFAVLTKQGAAGTIAVKDKRLDEAPLLVATCSRRLPPGAEVKLVWAAGIRAVAGGVSSAAQTLAFQVRRDFVAKLTCTHVNKDAGCVPVLPIELELEAPVARSLAEQIRLQGADGTRYPALLEEKVVMIERVSFKGPFPPKTALSLVLPEKFIDDAGRPLVNAASFPMKVAIDEDPPLIKFPSRFGILERNASPALPVTVRNVEAPLKGLALAPLEARREGIVARVAVADDAALAGWLKRVLSGPRANGRPLAVKAADAEGQFSIFEGNEARVETRTVELPRSSGDKAFEVIGIPLTAPGFHVVEFASPRLGAALFGAGEPYYVYSSALVTNLAVHFKRGRESSLVWVTTLDGAKAVAGAKVAVNDCLGAPLWSGETDAKGLARVERELPQDNLYQDCPHAPTGLLVTARSGDDLSFALTTWNEGIRSWNFNLGTRSGADGPVAAHTVFDRPLFRAGEIVSMKHFLRLRTGRGFAAVDPKSEPGELVIRHVATDQTYAQKLVWQGGAASSTWTIPQDAKLGEYSVQLTTKRVGASGHTRALESGQFRVEAFRVPLMKAVLKPPPPVIGANTVQMDAQLSYLSGGGAGYAPVKLRSRLTPVPQSFAEYADFAFGGTPLKEGIESVRPDEAEDASATDPSDTTVAAAAYPPRTQNLTLDAAGGGRFTFDRLPKVSTPHALEIEMEYADPNGQILSAAGRVSVLPSAIALGIKVEGFFATRDRMPFKVLALTAEGKPVAGRRIAVDAYERKLYAYRKRLLGGFYAYEQNAEVKRIGSVCSGTSDARGMIVCDGPAPASGQLTLIARTTDEAGNDAIASRELWVAGDDDWVFASGSDRIDILPDRRRYEPGERARLEVRMPFREATALVTVEREGILETSTVELSSKSPFIDLPIAEHFAPNAFVSVLVLRGRVDPELPGRFAWLKRWVYRVGMFLGVVKSLPREIDTRPSALVDLTKPAFKLGLVELNVGARAHELKVSVSPERETYRVRDKARVRIAVTDAAGKPAARAEIALAAVDEGLLLLQPNRSWNLLEAMLSRRALEVETSTGQSQVIGKRHFGKKAVAPGGGGGEGGTRELFDTLLLWRDRITLDDNGQASVEVPINDALSSFRIEAIAHAGNAQFGSGSAKIRTTQEVMLFAGLPQIVREGDRFGAMVTVRNGADRPLTLDLSASVIPAAVLAPQSISLAPGEGKTVSFLATVPFDAPSLEWTFSAEERGGKGRDSMKFSQRVDAAHPVRVYQASLSQLEGKPLEVPVELPAGAVPGRGGIEIRLSRSLGGDISAIRDWMARYPYTCLEQLTSRAVVAGDKVGWEAVNNRLPLYLDRDGLARYFPTERLEGDDALTAYVLSIADQAGLEIAETAREKMSAGLAAFVEGRITRYGALPTADLAIRKLAAIEALSRRGEAKPKMLDAIELNPNLWPSSAVIDWISILRRMDQVPKRAERLVEAKNILRSRLTMAGTQLTFSTEKSDLLWWLMVSPDLNSVKTLLVLMDDPEFRDDMPRLARGALGRQNGARWSTTVANAWGVLALQSFGKRFEREAVSGSTTVSLGGQQRKLDWAKAVDGALPASLPWPTGKAPVTFAHEGAGKPWLIVQSRAALPLKAPLFAGYTLTRTVTPVEQKTAGTWTRGDTYRVSLEVEAQTDMTWVVINDPVPSGAAILGTGLGTDSSQLTSSGRRDGAAWLAFEERATEAYRAYYRYMPKGKLSVQYTVRLNNPGRFEMPASRVEAMYAPESFGELPVAVIEVKE